jgi:serine protease AprX
VTLRSTVRAGVATAALATLGLGIASAGAAQAASPPRGHNEAVLVSGQPGAIASVRQAVLAAGGHIRANLPVIDGVSATLPTYEFGAVRAARGVRSVTPDAKGHLMGIDPTLGYDVDKDQGSLFDIAQVTHAKDAWGQSTGKGVDVALIDSGVAQVKGLTSGNVINGPDLSFESQNSDLTHLDTFGHGTHMASIIVGRDKQASSDTYRNAGSHLYVGIAPDARLVSIKVAAADGSADVSQVIAAIDWVTEYGQSNGLNIKVLNLSYGTNSKQDPSIDPLDYAVENAWRAGITVVVSAGNDGTNRQDLADPANDPLVLAVGADDSNNTDGIADDTVPDFSQRGTSTRHVDIINPGVHVLGLRDPGSFIDQNNPSAVVNSRFFRGSGTSQAAAVASGEAALYLSKYPNATPDQVKYALIKSATVPDSVKKMYAGYGVPDVNKAIKNYSPNAILGLIPTSTSSYKQPATGATGTGSLEAARGSAHVTANGVDLTGEQDIFGQSWNGWAAASGNGTAWNGGDFNGHSWTGSSWSGSSWTSMTWDGHSWTDNDWSGHSWTGHSWTGHSWTDAGWDGSSWSGSSWSGSSWSGSSWSGSSWSGSSWSDASWS